MLGWDGMTYTGKQNTFYRTLLWGVGLKSTEYSRRYVSIANHYKPNTVTDTELPVQILHTESRTKKLQKLSSNFHLF